MRANFDPLTCTATSAVLGSAGARFSRSATSRAQPSRAPGTGKRSATPSPAPTSFRASPRSPRGSTSNLGQPGCLTGTFFYLGLDNNHGASIDLVTVLLHEFGHGLNFQTFTNGTTGAFLAGFPSVLRPLPPRPDGEPALVADDATRSASASAHQHEAGSSWTGANVTAAVPSVLAPGTPELEVSAPTQHRRNLPRRHGLVRPTADERAVRRASSCRWSPRRVGRVPACEPVQRGERAGRQREDRAHRQGRLRLHGQGQERAERRCDRRDHRQQRRRLAASRPRAGPTRRSSSRRSRITQADGNGRGNRVNATKRDTSTLVLTAALAGPCLGRRTGTPDSTAARRRRAERQRRSIPLSTGPLSRIGTAAGNNQPHRRRCRERGSFAGP